MLHNTSSKTTWHCILCIICDSKTTPMVFILEPMSALKAGDVHLCQWISNESRFVVVSIETYKCLLFFHINTIFILRIYKSQKLNEKGFDSFYRKWKCESNQLVKNELISACIHFKAFRDKNWNNGATFMSLLKNNLIFQLLSNWRKSSFEEQKKGKWM